MLPRYWLFGVAMLSLVVSARVDAGPIRSPASVISSTILGVGNTTDHLRDKSGLSADFTSGVTDFATYTGGAPTHLAVTSLNGWASQAHPVPGYIEFDMGAVAAFSHLALWTQNTTAALDSFSLSTAMDAGFTTGVTNLGAFNAAIGSAVQTFVVSGVGEFVRLQINSSHGAANINIGEIAFDAVLVPEPASLMVLGTGIPLLGLLRRRRLTKL